jgi:hypothetical protein
MPTASVRAVSLPRARRSASRAPGSDALESDDGGWADLTPVQTDGIRSNFRRQRDLIEQFAIDTRNLEQQPAARFVPVKGRKPIKLA